MLEQGVQSVANSKNWRASIFTLDSVNFVNKSSLSKWRIFYVLIMYINWWGRGGSWCLKIGLKTERYWESIIHKKETGHPRTAC